MIGHVADKMKTITMVNHNMSLMKITENTTFLVYLLKEHNGKMGFNLMLEFQNSIALKP